jgi:hypothetical protein
MPEPVTKDDNEDDPDTSDGSEESPDADEADVEMVQTDIEETGADPDGFFDGVETDSNDDVSTDMFEDVDSGGADSSDSPSPSGGSTPSTGLADDINNGVARLAVIGLDDEWEDDDGESHSKTDLEDEFRETFEAFRLGHYGSICAEQYILSDAEDINPVWGLIGAALICSAVIVYKRPDGGQMVDSAKLKLGQSGLSNLSETLSTDTEDES